MKNILNFSLLMIFMGMFSSSSSAQENKSSNDRKAYAAGRFYSADPTALTKSLAELFKMAKAKTTKNVWALISPHAGYVYSGEVAASGFNQIDPDATFDNVFIIASSHQMRFDGASIYHKGDYLTPLGRVKVNSELASALVREHGVFGFRKDAHLNEHSLEVQLPFLQFHLKNKFQIVPILIGTQDIAECVEIADALKPYFNDRNLFVISSDLSHYPAYADAKIVDRKTVKAIVSNSISNLQDAMRLNKETCVSDLATSLCGWSSVFALLNLTQDRSGLGFKEIQYMNSGDQDFGDKSSVVGYSSIVIFDETKETTGFNLEQNEKIELLGIARQSIEHFLTEGKKPKLQSEMLSENLKMNLGAFVSLHKNNELRGCIGRFMPDAPLYQTIQDIAVASAVQDSRFEKVDIVEMQEIELEISVLTPMKKIKSIDEIKLGRDGIYISKGEASGTFLPQVASQTKWSLEEFLGHCAKDKAGIGWDGWKNAEIYTYEAIIFNEGNLE
jgi:MEMO1 family protein